MYKVKFVSKQLFVIFLSLLLLGLTIVPVSAEDNTKDFSYNVIDSSSVEIAGYNGGKTEVVIPESVNGRKVVSIGNEAFMENQTITSVVVPDTVTTIGDSAFFACRSLSSINMPKQLKKISKSAFGATSIQEFVAPDSLLEIGDVAFSDCENLKSVTLSKDLQIIGNTAFFACPKMTKIIIPENVKKIGRYAFGYKDYGTDKGGYKSPMVDPVKNDKFLISCYKNTAGEDYVIENGFDFEYLQAQTNSSVSSTIAIEETQTSVGTNVEPEKTVANTAVSSENSSIAMFVIIGISAVVIAVLLVIIILLLKGRKNT